MEIKYDESQDITLRLNKEEFERLISKQAKDFFENNTIRALSLEARAYFYLGHCTQNMIELRAYAKELDGGVQIILPDELEDSYYINLHPTSEAIRKLKEKRFYSTRYPGGSKLMIIIKEN